MPKDFLEGIAEIERAMAYHVAKGLGKAGHALMNDAIMDMPAVPLDEGTLRGSGSVFVGSDLVAVAQNVGGNPTPATELGDTSVPGTIKATVMFNTPYAARLHEHPEFHFQHSGTGGKFLENKMNANREKYFGIVLETIRQGIFENTL